MRPPAFLLLLGAAAVTSSHATDPAPAAKFRAQTIDAQVGIGYGLAIADVDGDGKPDILLADSKETVWFHHPDWEKHQLTGALTKQDHVCIAARDTDGDGKCEVAVGGEWNPGDTKNSGAVFTLTAPADRTGKWTAQEQHREPTTHRMQWVEDAAKRSFLAVLPLHGEGNKNGEGDPIRFLGYRPTAGPGEWPTFLLNNQFHLAHNFAAVPWPGSAGESLLVACKEGVHLLRENDGAWSATQVTALPCGEVRLGHLPDGRRFVTTVEPMHGNSVVVNPEDDIGLWSGSRVVLDDTLNGGHALAAADFLGTGYDQVLAGWREPAGPDKKVGLRLYVPT
ncbi:MAG: repeat-containing protein, partial [Akkermansiaceae bacterium]|nr:repeat-containing protein [Akkermansiaceae bacterium]